MRSDPKILAVQARLQRLALKVAKAERLGKRKAMVIGQRELRALKNVLKGK